VLQNGLKHAITIIISNFAPYQDSRVGKLLYEIIATKLTYENKFREEEVYKEAAR